MKNVPFRLSILDHSSFLFSRFMSTIVPFFFLVAGNKKKERPNPIILVVAMMK